MPHINAFPDVRSVVIFDNCVVHLKSAIYALCAVRGVLALFLPPYDYFLNPLELALKDGKSMMQNLYGLDNCHNPADKDKFAQCLYTACSPSAACHHFRHCRYEVTVEEEMWANR